MSGQLDEISEAIGALRADVGNLRASVDALSGKVERLDAALVVDKTDLAKLKAKGAGILIGVSLISGFVGSKFSGLLALLGRLAG